MTSIPLPLTRLVHELARLPGVGQKTAQRLAFSILRNESERAQQLAEAIIDVKAKIHFCRQCAAYAEQDLCIICSDLTREKELLCVVEQPADVYVLERSGVFKGVYHVLMGCISPIDGIGPEQLRIATLLDRVNQQQVQEVVLAINPSVPGEATVLHLQKLLQDKVATISRLAQGLPMGAQLEFADQVTLSHAFQGRQRVTSSL